MPRYWLSFATDDENLGVVITDALDIMSALAKCNLLRINPGGELIGFAIPENEPEYDLPRDRILTEAEIKAAGAMKLFECPPEVRDALESDE